MSRHRAPAHRPHLLPAWLFWPLLVLALGLLAVGDADAQPRLLSQTGLFVPGSVQQIARSVMAFEPVAALWSDGALKRRWLYLPAGSFIDARDPDAWRFPVGTRLWKEFALGRAVETRYMELGADGRWTRATYVWRADGSDADLAPATGAQLALAEAPGGVYALPSREDCANCHAGARSPVLGFSALQMAPSIPSLVARGLLRHGPAAWALRGPDFAGASEAEQTARAYLHANCGHCHHESGVPVPLVLAQRVRASATPSQAQLELALRRMHTREPMRQMPPLGTRLADEQGLQTLQAWLAERAGAGAPALAALRP